MCRLHAGLLRSRWAGIPYLGWWGIDVSMLEGGEDFERWICVGGGGGVKDFLDGGHGTNEEGSVFFGLLLDRLWR